MNIYVVTVIKLSYKTSHKGKQYLTIEDSRTPYFYKKFKDAIDCLIEDGKILSEYGYYKWAVIEKTREGPYPFPQEELWFKWKGGVNNGQYTATKKPKVFKKIVCFGIG